MEPAITAEGNLFRDRIIADHVRDLNFVDIGALWGVANEKVSVATRAGARSAAIIDVTPPGDSAWVRTREHCAARGVSGYAEYSRDLNDPSIHETVGTFDFAYCSGVLYHTPSIFYTLQRLLSLTKKYLMVGSMVVPETIENEQGALHLSGGGMLFVPGLTGTARAVVAAYFAKMQVQVMHITPGIPLSQPFMWEPGRPNYGPWWWLFPLSTLCSMIETVGFRVIETGLHWGGRSGSVFCERIT